MLSSKENRHQEYFVVFEPYLKPKQAHNTVELQFRQETAIKTIPHELQVTLLNHPVFTQSKKKSENDVQATCIKWPFIYPWCALNCLKFLSARNDNAHCKRKSGFEIYCELASIHGFQNFIDAKTWQRIIWLFVISIAIVMSTIVVVMSHLMNVEMPNIYYTESATFPAWTMPFPSVSICNLNRISKKALMDLSEQHTLNATDLQKIMWMYYSPQEVNQWDQNIVLAALNMSQQHMWTQLLLKAAPKCEEQLLHCSWKGRKEKCRQIFQPIMTPNGLCCSFNFNALGSQISLQTTNCGYKTGLSVSLRTQVADFAGSLLPTPGFEVIIHSPNDFPFGDEIRVIALARTEINIRVNPHGVYATDYVRSQNLKLRRCYFPQERRLTSFLNYTQSNCLAECRSKLIFMKCGCVPPFFPNNQFWPICELKQFKCLKEHSYINTQVLRFINGNKAYRTNRYSEQFICDCYPLCSFHRYNTAVDSSTLDRSYSKSQKRLFKSKNTNIQEQILLHIYYGKLTGEFLRLDASENWLTFLGTCGGITGLFMGCSFVSGFELFFFVIIRTTCNWLTKKKIQYRLKHRRTQIAAT